MPANDSRKSAEENLELMLEAVGHLDAAHENADETLDSITLGDFNYDPNDTTSRARAVNQLLQSRSYDFANVATNTFVLRISLMILVVC